MSQFARWRSGALLSLALALAACNQAGPTTPATAPTEDFRNEVIYFALTDRFHNGSTPNDNGAARAGAGDEKDTTNPLGWHGGDFAGLTKKIEEGYFRKLGFTAIWISPVVLQVPGLPVGDGPHIGKKTTGYHAYWAEDFFKVDPHFGTLDDLKTLVRTAHRNNIKIIQDVVVNHAGYGSSLVTKNPDWFNTQADCDAATNKDVYCGLNGLPDFKQEKAEVTKYLNDSIRYWIDETGIDGLRMDTMKHVPDTYWTQFFAAGGPGDPKKVWTVGEVYNGDPTVLAKYMDKLGSPSVFDFALYFAIKDNLPGGGSLDPIADVFARDNAYSDPRRLTTFVDNHDVKRFMSEALEKGANEELARERLDLAVSLLYAARGIPSVYYGTEIAMAGKGDPYNQAPGESNREDMNFAAVESSPMAARLAALGQARQKYVALSMGAQQELWRPNGGANILAFRRTTGFSVNTGERTTDPVVVVMNGGNTAVDLATLPGGGISLLGTFGGGTLTEITGRTHTLQVQGGKLVGTVPPRTLLAVSAKAGTGSGATVVNPNLGNPTGVAAQGGDAAARVTWTASSDTNVAGYRVYLRKSGDTAFTQLNFAPLPKDATSYIARGLTNGTAYELRVVGVDAQGAESTGATATVTPSSTATATVTFTVDARTQGNGMIELRRFDTGSQLEFPLTQTAQRGIWKTSIQLPLFREIKFKYGNDAANAKNSGYEAPGQSDRTVVAIDGATYESVYDFITTPVPSATVEGTVTNGTAGLARATVNAASNPDLHYALSFDDGTFFLRAPAGAQSLTARAPGYLDGAPSNVTAPAAGVTLTLQPDLRTKYTIDGVLTDWTSPRASVDGAADGLWGANNNFQSVRVDADEQYLYLGLTYTASDNSAIVHLDVKDGGFQDASLINAWKRQAVFNAGVDFFVARYNNDPVQVWTVQSGTTVAALAEAKYTVATTGSGSGKVVEIAIPWSELGLTGRPTRALNVYGGIYGGDNYGAGDIIPLVTGNSIDQSQANKATFTVPIQVPMN